MYSRALVPVFILLCIVPLHDTHLLHAASYDGTSLVACHWLHLIANKYKFKVDDVVFNDTSNIIPLGLKRDQKAKQRRPQLYQLRSAGIDV